MHAARPMILSSPVPFLCVILLHQRQQFPDRPVARRRQPLLQALQPLLGLGQLAPLLAALRRRSQPVACAARFRPAEYGL
jgi:hypothetical protein